MPEAEEGKETGKETEGGKETEKPEGKTFSQEDLNRIGAREKSDGKKVGRRELLADLGFESEDDLKAAATAHQAALDKDKSEGDKAKGEAEKAKAERDRADREAKQERLDRKIERALIKAGVPIEGAEKAVRLVDLDDLDADSDAVMAAVDQTKKEFPAVFKSEGSEEEGETEEQKAEREAEEAKAKGLPPSKPPVPPKGVPKGKSVDEHAKSLLHERHPELVDKK